MPASPFSRSFAAVSLSLRVGDALMDRASWLTLMGSFLSWRARDRPSGRETPDTLKARPPSGRHVEPIGSGGMKRLNRPQRSRPYKIPAHTRLKGDVHAVLHCHRRADRGFRRVVHRS